jgi:hypothetical protein
MRFGTYLLTALNFVAWAWMLVLLFHPFLAKGFDLNPNREMLGFALLGFAATLALPLWALRHQRDLIAVLAGASGFFTAMITYIFEGLPPPPFFF